MKALHIRKLSLWPRFHSVVRDDLEKNPIEVSMTDAINGIGLRYQF